MFQSIEFLQNDYVLISGGPEEKRRFLDISCSLLVPGYYSSLLRYNRALRQRNLQIRMDVQQNTAKRHLWDEILVQSGINIIVSRQKVVRLLQEASTQRIAGMKKAPLNMRLDYINQITQHATSVQPEEYRRRLHESERRENVFKTTVIGPHRDNIGFFHDDNKDMRLFASQGQIRMAVLSVKFALVDLLRSERNYYPVLLFDDAFIEIDRENTQLLLDSIGKYNQCLFSSTGIPDIPFFENRESESFYTFQ